MKSSSIRLIGALLVLGVTAGIAGPRVWRWWMAPPPGHCPICLRHEHKESLVKFQAAGEGITEVCCLSCALTYGRQTGKAITILHVTDHDNRQPLAPDMATFVVGSEVSPCTHAMAHVGPEAETYRVRWDRCLPSILAFASQKSAEGFRGEHGGRLRSLAELKQEAGVH